MRRDPDQHGSCRDAIDFPNDLRFGGFVTLDGGQASMKNHILLVLLILSADAHAARRGSSPPRGIPAQPGLDKRSADEAFVIGNYPRAVLLYTALLASPRLTPADRETIYLNRGYSNLRAQPVRRSGRGFSAGDSTEPDGGGGGERTARASEPEQQRPVCLTCRVRHLVGVGTASAIAGQALDRLERPNPSLTCATNGAGSASH